jgi:hypothetical protein
MKRIWPNAIGPSYELEMEALFGLHGIEQYDIL